MAKTHIVVRRVREGKEKKAAADAKAKREREAKAAKDKADREEAARKAKDPCEYVKLHQK